MAEKIFTKGLKLDFIQTRFGEIIKVGINLEEFAKNPNNKGWVNFSIKRSKDNKLYGEIFIPDTKN